MGKDREILRLFEDASRRRISRRDVLKRATALGLAAPTIAALLAACGGSAEPTAGTGGDSTAPAGGGATATAPASGDSTATPTSAATGPGVRGGVLRYVAASEPPTLDNHQSTATEISYVGWNIYEPLFAYDDGFRVIPMLAESHEISDDQLTHVIRLRKGVPFHNGEELKAADVEASLHHWAAMSANGRGLVEVIDTLTLVDDHTMEFKLKYPYGVFVDTLAYFNQGLAIYPKSVIDKVGDKAITEYIGTGPYKFAEQRPDQFIRLERFEDYAALPGEPSGYGGHKYQYLDAIQFIYVKDERARTAGLETGEYDYADTVTSDQVETLKNAPGIVIENKPPYSWEVQVLNWRSPLTGNVKIRQAYQAALDHDLILRAALGEGYYRLNPSIMFQETAWYTETGREKFNQANPELAKQLLEEAGYDGTPLRFIVDQQSSVRYNGAIVAKQQLEAAGFVVDLQGYDRATTLEIRSQEDKWEVTTTAITFRSEPTQLSIMNLCNWPGWWCDEETEATLDELKAESDFDKRLALWDKIQQDFYEDVPMIKLGDVLAQSARSEKLKGLSSQTQVTPILWNAWLEQ